MFRISVLGLMLSISYHSSILQSMQIFLSTILEIIAFNSIADEVTFERKSKRSRSEVRAEKLEQRIKNVETQTSEESGGGLCYYVSFQTINDSQNAWVWTSTKYP